MLGDLTISNGLGWSPDGGTMYLVDSGPRVVHAFTFDHGGGTISGGRVLVTLAEEVGAPDGMTVDAAGDLWVAIYGAGQVHRYSPDGELREAWRFRPRNDVLRVRRPGAEPALRHHGDRGLERRSASRRARSRPRLLVQDRYERPAGRAVSPGHRLVEGGDHLKASKPADSADGAITNRTDGRCGGRVASDGNQSWARFPFGVPAVPTMTWRAK